jgi:hypothetical protein
MTRCAVWVVSCVFLFLSAAGAAHAQTPGTVPVWEDPQTLGDSPLVRCGGDGGSVCIGPGDHSAIGPSTLMGFTAATDVNASAVYGEATAPIGATNGVVGVNQSGDETATGVFGWAINPAGQRTVGVWGRSSSTYFGRGVVGEGDFGVYGEGRIGVWGQDRSGSGIGVYGESRFGLAGDFNGTVRVSVIGGGTTQLCANSGMIATCSSSLRYKTDVQSFSGGLDIVTRLRPIAFTWKAGGAHDVGFAAEEVEQVEPLLTFRNDRDEIEGVKYNQLSAVFVNAIRDQQAQIERQQKQITEQQDELAALKLLVCQSHPDTDICR